MYKVKKNTCIINATLMCCSYETTRTLISKILDTSLFNFFNVHTSLKTVSILV